MLSADDEHFNEYVTLLGGTLTPGQDNVNKVDEELEMLGPITSKHLLKWSHQIAKGMEYLGSKKVHNIY